MSISLLRGHGTPLERQVFTWKDLVPAPLSKLNHDAFSRMRVLLMSAVEQHQHRFLHTAATGSKALRLEFAKVRRIEHHQQTMVHWLLGADSSVLESTIALQQLAIELTAAVAQQEPDLYLSQVYRFSLLEDFDHLYRFAALLDRVEGKDPNCLLQGYTDILPGRPTWMQHRMPEDDLRRPYQHQQAAFMSKVHAFTMAAVQQQARTYLMTTGPQLSDPLMRLVYAEIASVKDQLVSQYESLVDSEQEVLATWLVHEACEVYHYHSCVVAEPDPWLKALWERFLDYELGQLSYVCRLYEEHLGRDPAEVLPAVLPEALPLKSQRAYVRQVLASEIGLCASGEDFVVESAEPERSRRCRAQLNSLGSPSEMAAAGYLWTAGTELSQRANQRLSAFNRVAGKP